MLIEKNTAETEDAPDSRPTGRTVRSPLRLRLIPGYWVAWFPNRIAVACCVDRSELLAQVQSQGLDPASVSITEIEADDDPDAAVGGIELDNT